MITIRKHPEQRLWFVEDMTVPGEAQRIATVEGMSDRRYLSWDVRWGMNNEVKRFDTLDEVRAHFGVTHDIVENRGQYADNF